MTAQIVLGRKDVSEGIIMDFTKIHVLLTDGAARQTLTILHGLKEVGCRVTVLCGSKLDVCYASKLPDKKIVNKFCESAMDEYIDFVLSLVKTGEYDVIFPVAEMATNKITLNEDEIKKHVKIACAQRAVYISAFNKQTTFEKAMEIGIPCPNTRKATESIYNYVNQAKFPIIIKPRQGLGSIGFRKFETKEEFISFITSESINIDDYVVQEFVRFTKRPDAYIFMDGANNVKMSLVQEVVRWYPLDAGSATLTCSVNRPDVIDYSIKLLKALKWRGFANVCFMVDDYTQEVKLLEINGRIPAGIKMSWYCGFNVAEQMLELVYGEPVRQYEANSSLGKMARHSQSDLMWFIKSPNRFSFKPSWFSWKDTTDLVLWKGDIKPFLTYTFKGIFQYKSFIEKRRHK